MSFPQVELNTNKGRIVLELNTEKHQNSSKLLEYVRDGFMTALFSTVSLMVS